MNQTPPQTYEVFRREKEGAPMTHAGNITADRPELALIYAREVFGRRSESIELWVAPREAFMMLSDDDILQPPLDRSYRMVDGYRMRGKLRDTKTAEQSQITGQPTSTETKT
ncbi:MAG: phenylacetic acid degradation protein PaaB [Chloroflexi bacterium AL-W]|nr:phenylacetic acid degradation protein PaaB [Chloroflexi bacterium AL-N1]NOK71533.1 phenylacetic acid degradation protein PaaB [Chloroflexi bacterium AL-N10]NOK78879.1 phenylacetic acid degradation protein PaaB [Chloroflexi bacterium AL-N5]NOK86355.1 phenylacetic acid degradation protein PaaB [Chloroflexi bacterium AL-W]NOK93324.1 phenylacetic acid degradation protein PaaB [Chloroflexi bacterium AL-N15]